MEALQVVLSNTYNPNPEARHAAELRLGEILAQPGAFSALITVSCDRSIDHNIRVAASLVVKNNIREKWQLDAAVPMALSEKESVKHIILQSLFAETDNVLRGILAETVRNIADFDFPDSWPALIPEIMGNITSGDILRMYNSLYALRKVIKRYEFKHKEAREPLFRIIHATFPTLQALLSQISENNSTEAAMVVRVCFKIFWSCTCYSLPDDRAGVDVNFWFKTLAHFLNKTLPEASEGKEPTGQPIAVEDREAWPWWKVKKWSSRVITHFIQRYGNPNYAGEENAVFANFFKEHIAKVLLGPVMNTLAVRSNKGFVTDLVFRNCISYLSAASELSPSYKLMKPHLDFILFQVIFPSLCLTDTDMSLFDTDPIEFVRRVHTPLEDWVDVRSAAITLLQNLGRYRLKDTLPRLLPYIDTIFKEYHQIQIGAVAASGPVDFRRKEACFVAVASLSNLLMEKESYKNQLEPIIVNYVLPDFSNSAGYIRSRVCMFMENFYDLKWKNPAVVQTVLSGLLTCLRDPCIPVQSSAACTLRLFLTEESARPLVIPILPDIVREYFRIMSEVENDVILSALQTIVLEFGDEISGIAPMMVSELLTAYLYYSTQGEDDDEAAFSASQCLDTVSSVLESVKEKPTIFAQLQVMLLPLISKIVQEEHVEYIENALDMLSYLTYYSDPISNELYVVAGSLLSALNSWAADYIVEMSPTLMNFISKNPAAFLSITYQNESLVNLLFKVITGTLRIEQTNTRETKAAASITTCFVECNHGVIDHIIGPILQLAVGAIYASKSKSTTIKLMEVVMALIHYNASLFLSLINSDPTAGPALFDKLFSLLQDMENVSTERLIVVSFCSLFSLPVASLPLYITSNMKPMFSQMLRELDIIIEEEEKGSQNSDEDDESEDDEDEDDEFADSGDEDTEQPAAKTGKSRLEALNIPDEGYDEDEDCVNAEDEEYLAALAEMDENTKRKIYRDGELIDGEMDSDDDDYEGENFTSPIDTIDIVGLFKHTMLAAAAREPQTFTQLQQSLEEEDKARLMKYLS